MNDEHNPNDQHPDDQNPNGKNEDKSPQGDDMNHADGQFSEPDDEATNQGGHDGFTEQFIKFMRETNRSFVVFSVRHVHQGDASPTPNTLEGHDQHE
jgi:hypothetical protein